MIHDFHERLEWSEAASDDPFWRAIYQKAFPGMVSMALCSGNTVSQRMGIDRVVVLSSGKVLRIDEKKRSTVYNDILLEYISVDTTGAPGWIEKDLMINYLAYAFMPIRRAYLFPWDMLRRAWLHYGDAWKRAYAPPVKAQNAGYKTWSIAVPTEVLRKAVSLATVIQLDGDVPA